MSTRKTCGECPCKDTKCYTVNEDGMVDEDSTLVECPGYVWCRIMGGAQPKDEDECSTRRAFRILRDEVRRLRDILKEKDLASEDLAYAERTND